MYTSCINHPVGSKSIVIRDWQFYFWSEYFGTKNLEVYHESLVFIALMSFFEDCYNAELAIAKKMTANNIEIDFLLWHSESEIMDQLVCFDMGVHVLRNALSDLQKVKVISLEIDGHDTRALSYKVKFHPEVINNWLEKEKYESDVIKP